MILLTQDCFVWLMSKLSMRPLLSAIETYNYKLAPWLDISLKPLSVNKSTISDPFKFAEKSVKPTFNYLLIKLSRTTGSMRRIK